MFKNKILRWGKDYSQLDRHRQRGKEGMWNLEEEEEGEWGGEGRGGGAGKGKREEEETSLAGR